MFSTTFFEFFPLVAVAVGLIFSGVFWCMVCSADHGNPAMQKVAHAIAVGARAFLRRQYKTISIFAITVGLLIGVIYGFIGGETGWIQGAQVGGSFLLGAFFSALAGVISMVVATSANLKTASAARSGVDAALRMSLRGGSVAALLITSISLLGILILYYLYHFGFDVRSEEIPKLIVGYGFGASFVALFAQLGGGIYTKAADVGADLVGKIEAGIPEDDPRNPAVIADLVGDNVGDCAGRGADLFESISAENIGAMLLGALLYDHFGINGVLFPLTVHAFGLLATIVGVYSVKAKEKEEPMKAMTRGFWVTSGLSLVGLFFACTTLLVSEDVPGVEYWLFGAGVLGLLTSIAFLYLTDYYTGKNFSPVKSIADASQTGHATNIISGTAVGMESTAFAILGVCIALLGSYFLGEYSGLEDGGLYATAVATMGMLSVVGYVLAMDMFGPITDNAGGIVEMSKAADHVRVVTDELDATGNTTKALTKGYAVGSAALAAFLLFSAFKEDAGLDVVDLSNVKVFVGGFLGAGLVFYFTSLAIRAVGRAAGVIVEEVRRQFKDNTGIMEGKQDPDYAAAVDIATKSALHEMVLPGIVAIVAPIAVGLLLRAEAVAGFLMVGTITGIAVAVYLNNSGGAWDNAKKLIETGYLGGKRSPAHQAAVTGDTVGDPFKDTAGPSLHVLIKLISTLTLALAALFI